MSILIAPGAWSEPGYFYVVKRGEVASAILHDFGLKPIYGSRGSLVWLAAANPEIEDIDRIHPGVRLYFSADLVEKALRAGRVQITEDQQIIRFTNEIRAPAEAVEEKASKPALPVENSTGQMMNHSPIGGPTNSFIQPDELVLHRMQISGGYKFTTLSAVDSTTGNNAEILSSRDAEIASRWRQAWSSSFETFQETGVRNIGFEPTGPGSKDISVSEKSAARLEVGAVQRFSLRTSVSYSLLYAQEFFIRGLTTNAVTVDAVALPSAGLALRHILYSRDTTFLGLQAEARYVGGGHASSYSIHGGQRYEALFFLQKQTPQVSVEAGFGYAFRNQDTSITRQSESSGRGYLQFSWPIFEAVDEKEKK